MIFECASCKEKVISSPEEQALALKEAEDNFKVKNRQDGLLVCSFCYHKLVAKWGGLEKLKAEAIRRMEK